jgi:methyl-accepting chemotaxis protein
MEARSGEITDLAGEISSQTGSVAERISQMAEEFRLCDRNLKDVNRRTETLHDVSDELTTLTAGFYLAETLDRRFVRFAWKLSSQLSVLLESGIAKKHFSEADLFSGDYKPIPNSNPQQFLSPITLVLEECCAPLIERFGGADPDIASVGMFDRKGFLAVTVRQYAQPQTADAQRNEAYSRNRRFHRNRATVKACANSGPFLLQGFRRSVNGVVAMFKDVSAPLLINQRHWGAVRIIYRTSD